MFLMQWYTINGQKPLSGEIAVSGAKNFALKIVGAALMTDGPLLVTRVPEIEDMHRMLEIMESLGVSVTHDAHNHTVTIDASTTKTGDMCASGAGKLRGSVMLIGPLMHRLGSVSIPHPGGCVLGKRPIDLFIRGYKALGATVEENERSFTFSAKELTGAKIVMPVISHTATEALMVTATRAKGTTIIHNASPEPEVAALADALNSLGAKITGAGTHTITIEGVDSLSGGEVACIPDRLETGTFAIMAAATRSEITITDCNPGHVESLLATFEQMGIPFSRTEDTLTIHKFDGELSASDIKTHEYPGFATDYQAPMTVLLTQAKGTSMVHETIFDGRLFYTDLLNRMGASIVMCDPHRVLVQGPTPLRGKTLESPDIRAGIAMVIAGLIAKGETTIHNIYQIERGYERIDERLRALGADITRHTSED